MTYTEDFKHILAKRDQVTKVFSKEPLNRMSGEKFFVTFSPHDFSVCYPVSQKKQ